MRKLESFKIICLKCGCENVEIEADESFGFDGEYDCSYYNGSIVFRCTKCDEVESYRE